MAMHFDEWFFFFPHSESTFIWGDTHPLDRRWAVLGERSLIDEFLKSLNNEDSCYFYYYLWHMVYHLITHF